MPSKTEPVLIIGAGVFGLATAHKLATSGYTDITVLEKDDRVPSRFSGGYDLNKIIRAEYIDPFYTQHALNAIRQWQTNPLYQPYFRQVGFLNVVTAEANAVVQNALAMYNKSVVENPTFDGYLVPCPDADHIRRVAPQFTGALPGWKGYLNRLAGYAQSSNAMGACFKACAQLGVTFKLGADGEVAELLYQPGSKVCVGARTKSGAVYAAARTIVAAGGFVANVLPSIAGQVTAICWGVSHIQLTPDESEQMRGMPVTTVRDIGFFFEPDAATHKVKICYLGGGYTHTVKSINNNNNNNKNGTSIPYSTLAESGYIPAEDVKQTRRMLRMAVPHIAERPLIDTHLCWVADTDNSDYIIDFVPGSDGSLVVLSGDSGHGFKMMPIFGDFVQDLLAANTQKEARWRWRDVERNVERDAAGAGKGKQVSWRASAIVDLDSTPRARL